MSTFATVIVTKANQSAAQGITSVEHFITELKKGLSKYYISSGYFTQEQYDAIVASDFIHTLVTDDTERPTHTIAALGMSVVNVE